MPNWRVRRKLMLLGLGLVFPGVLVEVRKNARRKAVRDERVAAGLCRDCGKEPYEGCHVRCKRCREEHAYQRHWRRNEGLCYDCGAEPEPGRTRCAKCRARVSDCQATKHAKVRWCACGKPISGRGRRCQSCAHAQELITRQRWRDSRAQFRADLKRQVYEAYGNACVHCGAADPNHLNIDHVHNDGGQDRFPSGKRILGTPLYRRIIAMGFPADFQILCRNCNYAKYLNGGVLPARCDEHGRPERKRP